MRTGIFLLIVLFALSGCETHKVGNLSKGLDRSIEVTAKGFRTIKVEPEYEFSIGSAPVIGDLQVGDSKVHKLESRKITNSIEETILAKFGAIGLVENPKEFDLHVIYWPTIESKPNSTGYDTLIKIWVVGYDSKAKKKLFSIDGEETSHLRFNGRMVRDLVNLMLDELTIFEDFESATVDETLNSEIHESDLKATSVIRQNGNFLSISLISDWEAANEEWLNPSLPDTPIVTSVDTYQYGQAVIPFVMYSFKERGEGNKINAVMRGEIEGPNGEVNKFNDVTICDGFHPTGFGMNSETFGYVFELGDDEPGRYKISLEIENRISGEIFRSDLLILLEE